LFIVAFPILIFATLGMGLRLLTLFKWEHRSSLVRFFIAMTLGFSFLGQFIYLLGLLHLLYAWIIWLAIILMALLNFGITILFFKEVGWRDNFVSIQNLSFVERVLLFVSIIVILLHGFFSLAPQIHWDAEAHHYLVPWFFLKHHAVIDFPDVIFSYYPSIIEMIYLAAMGIGGEQTANLTGWFHTTLMYIGVFAVAISLFRNYRHGIWASIIFLSTQGIHMHFEGGWNDMGVSMFIVASIIVLFENGKKETGALFLSAILMGAALASKHYAWIPFIFALVFIFIDLLRRKNYVLTSLKLVVIYFLTAFSMPLIWYIRSLILTGNPVYPFSAFGLFPTYLLPPFAETSWVTVGFSRNIITFITYPILLMFGSNWIPELTGRLPYLLLLAPFSLLYIKKAEVKSIWFFLIWIFVVMYFIAPFETRYMYYMLPFAAILASLSVEIYKSRISASKNLVILLVFIIFLIPFSVNQSIFDHYFQDRLKVILKLEWRDKYLFRQSHNYSMLWWMNRNLPEDTRILCLEQKLYRLDRDFVTWYGMKEKYPENALEAWEKNYRHGNTHMYLGEGGMANAYILWHIYHLPTDNQGYVIFQLEDVMLNLEDEPIPKGFWILRQSAKRSLLRAGFEIIEKDGQTFYKIKRDILDDALANHAALILVDLFKDMLNRGWIVPLKDDGLNMIFEFNYNGHEQYFD